MTELLEHLEDVIGSRRDFDLEVLAPHPSDPMMQTIIARRLTPDRVQAWRVSAFLDEPVDIGWSISAGPGIDFRGEEPVDGDGSDSLRAVLEIAWADQ